MPKSKPFAKPTMIKLLEFIGYIKLPDDFEGDEIDALKYYIKYREAKDRKKTYYDVPKRLQKSKDCSMKEYMEGLYEVLKDSGNVRGGNFKIHELKDGEWSSKGD